MGKKKANKRTNPLVWIIKTIFRIISGIFEMIIRGLDRLFHISKPQISKTAKKIANIKTYYEPFMTIEANNGSFSKLEKFIASNPSTIGIILGARGTGKSAIGLKLMENFHEMSKKSIYAMGFKQEEMPQWLKIVESLDEVENNSFLLIDEGGILFSSRKSFSNANKLLSELLLIARHKDLSVIFISQNSANLEINAIRQADYLILKPSSLLQKDFERKKIKEIYDMTADGFRRYQKIRGISFFYSDQFKGFVSNPLPSFWNTDISKSFSSKK